MTSPRTTTRAPGNWYCPEDTHELMTGQTPADQQPPFLVYEFNEQEDILSVGSPLNGGLPKHPALEVSNGTTIIVKPHSVIAGHVMTLNLTLENVKTAHINVLVEDISISSVQVKSVVLFLLLSGIR